MTDDEATTPPRPSRRRWVAIFAGLVALAAGLLGWRHVARERALEAQATRTKELFDPALDALDPRAKAPTATPPAAEPRAATAQPYDLDRTVRVIHEIDVALRGSRDIREYLRYMASHDYGGVAPEIRAAHRAILAVLARIYAKQTELDDQQAVWELATETLLSGLSLMRVDGGVGITGAKVGLAPDPQQSKKLLDEWKQQKAERRHLVHEVGELENELLAAMMKYSETQYRYLAEWDALCALRDRAYLAAHDGDFRAAVESADRAIAMAPREREAHLLKALALIEAEASPGEREPPPSAPSSEEVPKILDEYMKEHPGSTAPALVLRGAWRQAHGQTAEARLDFEQAAAYYPKQADELTDLLDPYRSRSFLRKSKEGNLILELYKDTMLGAGWFSPDLHLAAAHYAAGNADEGKKKVLDHFSRRRQQKQWDFVLSDIRFCQQRFGARFLEIFPEESYLDLLVKPTLFGNKLSVGIQNRSDRTLHNVTLVLALHLTDMHRDDYETVAAGDTQPAVVAHALTDFGDVPIELQVFGARKTVKDVVQHRAIAIADEAVCWVDTDQFKISESEEFAAQRRKRAPEPAPDEKHDRLGVERIVGTLGERATLRVKRARFGKDDLAITLPRELSILKPVFRLQYGDRTLRPDENRLTDDAIELVFAGVENVDDAQAKRKEVKLLVSSPFRDLELTWPPADGGWAPRPRR